MRRFPVIAIIMLTPLLGRAQQSTDGPYVLHEYVEQVELAPDAAPSPRVGEPSATAPARAAGEPPALALETRPGEPIYDKDGPVFDRPIPAPYGELAPYAGANTLDQRTDRVDSLTYFASFDPSVIPYKRVVVKNYALVRDGDYLLEVWPGERRTVVPELPPSGPHDTFWGTFLLRLERGRLHPLASVSPDQRILQIVAEPDIPMTIEVDEADNFFVRAESDGLVRVNLQIAVPAFYFGGPLPDVGWDEFPVGLVPPLAAPLRGHALKIAQKLGFTRANRPAVTLVAMVEYFRDFDARPFPAEFVGEDLLEAITTHAIGVCRHRSLAFVFLAQSLGIPTRYVYNEAHAFVEVFWPGYGWRRLDLGGAANELNASANDGRAVHDPGNDGLPTPPRFIEEQQRMAHNGWEPPASATAGRDGGNGAVEGGNRAEGTPTAEGHAAAHEMGQTNAGVAPASPPDELEPGATAGSEVPFQEPPPDERAEARLRILRATAEVRRGDELTLEATLSGADGRPLAGRGVEVYLGPVGSTSTRAATRIGVARTDGRGRFVARVTIPREHAIGRWSVFVHFPGDTLYRPATAD